MAYKGIIIGLLILVLVFATLGALFQDSLYTFFRPDTAASPTEEVDAHERLTLTNDAYRRADLLRSTAGNSQEVVTLYRQALTQATNPEERGQVKIKIASTSVYPDPLSAIAVAKEIIADTDQSDLQRANAAQLLGQIYYRHTDDADRIIEAIFSGEPYRGFYTEEDVSLALRRLFEYASSFYPLAISELRIARWYVDDIRDMKKDGEVLDVEQETIDSHLVRINEHLIRADFDIARTGSAPNALHLIPEALARKAEVLGELSLLDEGMVTDEVVDEAYQTAIRANLLPQSDGPPRINYAIYLVEKYGSDRVDNIVAVLEPLTTDIESYPEIVSSVLRTERDDILGLKSGLAKVAAVDSTFASLLRRLGWVDADFELD